MLNEIEKQNLEFTLEDIRRAFLEAAREKKFDYDFGVEATELQGLLWKVKARKRS